MSDRRANSSNHSSRTRILCAVLLIGLIVVVVAAIALQPSDPGQSLTDLSHGGLGSRRNGSETSRVSNEPTDTNGSEYVGAQVCAECHRSEHQSYRRTAHSDAFSTVEPQSEPSDGRFHQELSGRDYEVFRKEGRLMHREALRNEDGELIADAVHPLKYLVGSGRHSRTYLMEVDGFLLESPITWYASKKKWDVSPGYDQPGHGGFERPADWGCLVCHMGRATPVDDAYHKLTIHEMAIGCERCHGPGGHHVRLHKVAQRDGLGDSNQQTVNKLTGDNIVHPGRLSRQLNEAICAQCHLRGESTVPRTGKNTDDFRPGDPLTKVRVDYRLRFEDSSMKVVGHVEQMRMSACYQKTATLTCTTCHDPHSPLQESERLTHYRKICMDCHADQGCKLPEPQRRLRSSSDNCVQCHMPQVPTDIPHIAFTHHRIALHDEPATPGAPAEKTDSPHSAEESPDRIGVLEPYFDLSDLNALERQRCLGLAYLETSNAQSSFEAHKKYRQRARTILQEVYHRGVRDGEVQAALARIYWRTDPLKAMKFATDALQSPRLSSAGKMNALLVAADLNREARRFAEAILFFQQLTLIRRNSEDYLVLGLCFAQTRQWTQAEAAMKNAIQLNPFNADAHEYLGELLKRNNRKEEAQPFLQTAEKIRAASPEDPPANPRAKH